MGKKSEKKAADDVGEKKKKRKGRGLGAAELMTAVQGCPPSGQFHFEWVVGNGLGEDAVRDAQLAHARALAARIERAERAARSPRAGCEKGCTGDATVLGPLHGRQHWHIEADAEPARATTWSWVGFVAVCDCQPEGLA
jgi:hypothetical protein